MTMTGKEIAERLFKLHTNNIVHSKIYCSRIASYRDIPLDKFDQNKVDSFIEIAAMSFGMDETIAGLVSIVELDVLLQYNAAISASLRYYDKIGTSQSFKNCYDDDCNFFISFAASRSPLDFDNAE